MYSNAPIQTIINLISVLKLLPSPKETLKLIAPQRSRLIGKQPEGILVTAMRILLDGVGPGDLPVDAQEHAGDLVLAGLGVVERVRRQRVARDGVAVQQLLVVDVAVELDGRPLEVARLRVLRVGGEPLDARDGELGVLELRPRDRLVRDDGDAAPGGQVCRHGGVGGVLAVDGGVARRGGIDLEVGLAAVLADLVRAWEGLACVGQVLDDDVWDCGGEGRHEQREGSSLLHFGLVSWWIRLGR